MWWTEGLSARSLLVYVSSLRGRWTAYRQCSRCTLRDGQHSSSIVGVRKLFREMCGPKIFPRVELVVDVLFFKKSRTSLLLKSRTGTWCTAGALFCAAGAGAGPAALPLPPQALPVVVEGACCRPPSLVGVFAPELRFWLFPCPGRRQLMQ